MKPLRRLLALALLLVFAGTAASQPIKLDPKDHRTNPVILKAFRSVVAKPRESTVRVFAGGKDVAFGIIVGADGWILTKWDEIKDQSDIVCKTMDGKELKAKLIGVHPEYDLAMLKVQAKGLHPIEWHASKDAKVGRWVASVGLGEDPIAIGVVSVAVRKLAPGDQPPKNMNVNSGYLGVGLAAGMDGARITKVEAKSPAQKAGLKIDDIIFEAAGKKIPDQDTLIDTIGRLRVGDKVLLKVKRGEEELELKATLGKRTGAALGNPQEVMGSVLSNRRGGFPTILQHDTVLKPADCGGPLVDLDGKAVGINIARAGRTETYAVPADDVLKLLPDLKSGKALPKEENAKVVPLPKAEGEILRVTASLTAKDPASKLGKGRFMKVHDVKLKAGVTYVIEMDSGEIDSYLLLEDAKGKKLAEDDDGGGFPNAKLVFTAPSDGDYRIVATTFDPNQTGNYTLTVRKQK